MNDERHGIVPYHDIEQRIDRSAREQERIARQSGLDFHNDVIELPVRVIEEAVIDRSPPSRMQVDPQRVLARINMQKMMTRFLERIRRIPCV